MHIKFDDIPLKQKKIPIPYPLGKKAIIMDEEMLKLMAKSVDVEVSHNVQVKMLLLSFFAQKSDSK